MNFSASAGLRIPLVSTIVVDPSNSARIYVATQTNPGDAFAMKIAP